MKRISTIAMAILGCLVFLAVSAVTEAGEIRIGKLSVVPSIEASETYDDNIFLGSGSDTAGENEVDDFVTKIAPAIGVEYKIPGRGTIGVGIDAEAALYADNSDNNWMNVGLFGNLNYKAPGGIYVQAFDMFNDAEDPYGSENQYNAGIQTKRWTNLFTMTAGYEVGRMWRFEGYLDHYRQEYDEDKDYQQNYDQYELGGGVAYKFMPKTWGFARYRYGDRDYNTHLAGTGSNDDNDADQTWHRINVGVQWAGTPKLSGEFNIGYQIYDTGNDFDLNGNAYEDADSWIAGTRLTFKPTIRTKINLNVLRNLLYTASNSREYYYDTGVSVDLEQDILFDFVLKAGAGYNVNDYNTNGRNDDIYRLGVGLDYKFTELVVFGASYEYKRKESSTDNAADNFGGDNEYDVNQLGVFVKASY